MKKCVFVNLNVGSAIEQSGNEILNYVKKIKNLKTVLFKNQTSESIFFDFLLNELPDIIVINGDYSRVQVPVIYYKKLYKNTKIIFISRVLDCFNVENTRKYKREDFSIFEKQRLEIFYDLCNTMVCVNSCGKFSKYFPQWSDKTIDCCGLNDPYRFKITKKWKDRTKNFVMIGSLNPHKVSPEFLKILDVPVDVYGHTKNIEVIDLLESNKNINFKGFCEFEKVPEILNEYKYSIFPHNGYEPFCNTLQQCILCGTTPIFLEDKKKDIFDNYWYDWAEGLYIPAENEKDLLKIMKNHINNGNDISEEIRKKIIERFDLYNTFSNIVYCIEKYINRGFKWDSAEHL